MRSSFNKAFSKKGVKLPMSYADIEEISTPETSAPSSPKIRHDRDDLPTIRMPPSASSSSGLVEECKEGEEKVVSTLRSELWEKERKLTDINQEHRGGAEGRGRDSRWHAFRRTVSPAP
ncbi:hypothetical protein CRUP_032192, partial [Coryphaenoides rupestris]